MDCHTTCPSDMPGAHAPTVSRIISCLPHTPSGPPSLKGLLYSSTLCGLRAIILPRWLSGRICRLHSSGESHQVEKWGWDLNLGCLALEYVLLIYPAASQGSNCKGSCSLGSALDSALGPALLILGKPESLTHTHHFNNVDISDPKSLHPRRPSMGTSTTTYGLRIWCPCMAPLPWASHFPPSSPLHTHTSKLSSSPANLSSSVFSRSIPSTISTAQPRASHHLLSHKPLQHPPKGPPLLQQEGSLGTVAVLIKTSKGAPSSRLPTHHLPPLFQLSDTELQLKGPFLISSLCSGSSLCPKCPSFPLTNIFIL